MVKNYMEELVDEYLAQLLKTDRYSGICKCERCMDDIRAKALNNIKPFYITCVKGKVYGEYFTCTVQNKLDIITEITKAIECISKNKHS